ncbi:hypothetical protein PsYK624_162230 [Phanerochaete sordida]|uniref:F-box domain-containing protein n=1 Tax=Phanerochaete sordida TaxID=48140 RepID=A0A9P3GQI7_9APHY|nr:hypothetical protein PsYK624_162230 [Phanerochaete sordida]
MSPIPRTKSLLDLPTELLDMIASEFAPLDLLSHAAFALLSPRTYARFPEDTWAKLTRAAGFGRLLGETCSWRAIALQCARHAWACEHPECGMGLLKQTVREMEEAVDFWGERVWSDPLFEPTDPNSDGEEINGPVNSTYLVRAISFRRRSFLEDTCPGTGDVPFLTSTDAIPGMTARPRESLHEHPVAYRSFATFPPINVLRFANIAVPLVENPGGVTAGELLNGLGSSMGTYITVNELTSWLEQTDEALDMFPAELSFPQILVQFKAMRDWFRYVKIHSFSDMFSAALQFQFEIWFEPRGASQELLAQHAGDEAFLPERHPCYPLFNAKSAPPRRHLAYSYPS